MNTAPAEQPVRGQRLRQRQERLRAAIPPAIHVMPSTDKMRRLIKHPQAGGFRAEGGAEWPNDRFTKRRLAEGVITREERPRSDKDKGGHQHRRSSSSGALPSGEAA